MIDDIGHLSKHNSNPDLYITCSMCKVRNIFLSFGLDRQNVQLCIYFHRFRFGYQENQFREHVYIYIYIYIYKMFSYKLHEAIKIKNKRKLLTLLKLS